MASSDGSVVIDVLLDDGQVARGVANMEGEFDRLGSRGAKAFKGLTNAIKGVGLAAGAALGAGSLAIGGLVESTAELNGDLARLKANANAAGFGFEAMQDGMKKVASVTGEMDSAVETMSNLMATDFSENQVAEALDYINGAAIKFSDTLKTEGIADGLQETFATGEAIGPFAELLERSGVNLDTFNAGLKNAAKTGSETDYVLQQMASLGLGSVYEEYQKSNPEITAYNDASTNLQLALAELGKTFTPLVTASKQFLTSIVELVNGSKTLDEVLDGIVEKFANTLSSITGIDVSVFINTFNEIKTVVLGVIDTVENYVVTGLAKIKGFWSSEGEGILETARNKFTAIQEVVLPILEGVVETLVNLFNGVRAVWETDGQAIVEHLTNIFNSIKDIVVPIVEDAIQLIITNFGKIKEFWDTNGQQIVQAVSNIFQGILAVVEFVMPAVKFVIDYVWAAIKNVITGALDVIMGAVKIFSGLFTGDFEKMWEGVKQLFSGAVDLILGIMSLTFIGGIRTALVNLGKTGISLIKGMWDDIAKLFTGAGSAITNTVSKMATSVVNFFKNIWTQGSNIFGTLKTFGANTFNALKQAVTTTVSGLVTSVVTFIRNLSTNFVNLIAKLKTSVVTKFNEIKNDVINKVKEIDLMQIGKDIVSGLINGVGAMFVNVKTKIEELASLIPDWAKKILGIHSPSRVMKQIGEWTGEGLAIGIDNTQSTVVKSMQDLGYLMLDVADHYADEQVKMQKQLGLDLAKANKESSEKITNIQSKANDKVAAIQTKASKKKRALSASEKAEIAKIEKNAANEISKIKSDAIEKNAKLESTASKNSIKALEEADKEYLATVQAFIDDKKSLDQLNIVEEGEIWKQSILLFDEGTTERIKAQQKYKAAVETVNKEVLSINSEYQAQMQQIDANYIAEAEKINKAYEDTFNARVATLLNFAGTFDEFKIELNRTGEELMINLQGQVDGFKQWQEEFEKLSGRGIDSDLLEELSDLGVKALPELTALNSMTDEQLTKYSELYREKSQLAREQAAKELEGMKKDTDQKLLDLRTASDAQLAKLQTEWDLRIKNLVRATDSELSTLQQVGVDAGQGLLDGLASMESPLIDKATEIANAIKATIQSALDIHSPSRWMRDFVAGNLAKGFDIGVDKHLSIFKNAASNIGELIKPNIVNPLRGVKADLGTFGTKSLSQINNNTQSSKIDNSRSFKYYITAPGETASDYDRMMRKMQFEAGL